MVKIVVDQIQNIAMLRSSTLDCYLTGHTDSGIVDGRVSIQLLYTYKKHYRGSIYPLSDGWLLANCNLHHAK